MTEHAAFEPTDLLARGALFASAEPGSTTALLASSCRGCGRTAIPRIGRCLACGAATIPVELAGPAVLDVRTAVLSQPPGALVSAPYAVGVARFADAGLCVIGLLDGAAEVGDALQVVVIEPYPGGRAFAFRAMHHPPTPED